MKYLCIDSTDIRVSRLAFGTASLHHLFSSSDRQNVLDAAADAGISHFDTSPYYGYGLAESDLGRFAWGRRSSFTIATKVGLYPWGLESTHAASVWVRKALREIVPRVSLPVVNWTLDRAKHSLEQSLRRLKTDYVDFMYLHEPVMALIAAEEFLHWISSEQVRGTMRSCGVAGLAVHVAPWVRVDHALAKVIQTQDSLDRRQADFLLESGRPLQFTYGYLSSQSKRAHTGSAESILRRALERNDQGSIIVSTRRADRIRQLARAVS